MARPLPILGGILLSFSPPAEATAQYSIIPEPSRTEFRQETAKTLQLLSDQEAPSLGTDAYRLTVIRGAASWWIPRGISSPRPI